MRDLSEELSHLLPDGWDPRGPANDSVTDVAEPVNGETPLVVATHTGTTVTDLIAEEAGIAPEAVRGDARLVEDLELAGLALWSVVAQVERELRVTFPDRQIEAWETVRDLQDAVRAAQESLDVP